MPLTSYPVTNGQERVYILSELLGSPAYNVPIVYKLRQSLDITRLSAALQNIVFKHESLRTTYKIEGGSVWATVHESEALNISVEEIRDIDFAPKLKSLCEDRILLSRTPLLCARVLQSESYYYLVLIYHHICVDGWSQNILNRDLIQFYFEQSGQDIAVDDSYRDHAAAYWAYRDTAKYKASMTYWRNQLGALPLKHIPFSRTAKHHPHADEGVRIFSYLEEDALRLTELSKKTSVTKYAFLLSVWKLTVHRRYRQEFMLGSMVANRQRPQHFNTVGFFANFVVHRVSIHEDSTFRAFARETQKELLYALAHSDFPLSDLLNEAGLVQQSSNTFFNVFVNYNNTGSFPVSHYPVLKDLLSDHDERLHQFNRSKFDLTLFINDQDDGQTRLAFEYRNNIDPLEIRALVTHYDDLVRHFANESTWDLPMSGGYQERETHPSTQILTQYVYDLLTLDHSVSATSDYFLSGGNSFLLLRIVSYAKEHLNVESVDLSQFLRNPSIENLVTTILREPVLDMVNSPNDNVCI